jgi:hypothetical protein
VKLFSGKLQLSVNSGMGVMLGAILGLALILTDQNIFQFIVSSSSPLTNMAVFVGRALPSHNKGPSIWGWGLWYADKPGAWWVSGGWGKRPAHRQFGSGDYSESVSNSSL